MPAGTGRCGIGILELESGTFDGFYKVHSHTLQQAHAHRIKQHLDVATIDNVVIVANVFFQFPGRRDERRFFATRLGRAVLVWLRTAQGPRGAPLICGRALALVMKLAAGTVQPGSMCASTYVDGPIWTFVGNQAEQDTKLAKF